MLLCCFCGYGSKPWHPNGTSIHRSLVQLDVYSPSHKSGNFDGNFVGNLTHPHVKLGNGLWYANNYSYWGESKPTCDWGPHIVIITIDEWSSPIIMVVDPTTLPTRPTLCQHLHPAGTSLFNPCCTLSYGYESKPRHIGTLVNTKIGNPPLICEPYYCLQSFVSAFLLWFDSWSNLIHTVQVEFILGLTTSHISRGHPPKSKQKVVP